MASTEQEVVLRLSRRFGASRERVFDAWTNPEVLREWWAAGETWETPLAEVDLRLGGRYRLSMRDPETGNVHTVRGEYTEVHPPERLAYTWAWEQAAGPLAEETLVEVDFAEDGDGTVVTLTHRGFGTEEIRDQHEHGWNACLDNLGRRVLER